MRMYIVFLAILSLTCVASVLGTEEVRTIHLETGPARLELNEDGTDPMHGGMDLEWWKEMLAKAEERDKLDIPEDRKAKPEEMVPKSDEEIAKYHEHQARRKAFRDELWDFGHNPHSDQYDLRGHNKLSPNHEPTWDPEKSATVVFASTDESGDTMVLSTLTPSPHHGIGQKDVYTHKAGWIPVTGTLTVNDKERIVYVVVQNVVEGHVYELLAISLTQESLLASSTISDHLIPFACEYNPLPGPNQGLYMAAKYLILPPVSADVYTVGRYDMKRNDFVTFKDFEVPLTETTPSTVLDPCKGKLYIYLKIGHMPNHRNKVYSFDINNDLKMGRVRIFALHETISPVYDYYNQTILALANPGYAPGSDTLTRIDFDAMNNGDNADGNAYRMIWHQKDHSWPLEGVRAYDSINHRYYSFFHRVPPPGGHQNIPHTRGLGSREGINHHGRHLTSWERTEHEKGNGRKPFYFVCLDARPMHPEPWVHFSWRIRHHALPWDMAVVHGDNLPPCNRAGDDTSSENNDGEQPNGEEGDEETHHEL